MASLSIPYGFCLSTVENFRIFESEREVELMFGAMYKAEIMDVLEHGVMVTLHKGMRPILLKNRFVRILLQTLMYPEVES